MSQVHHHSRLGHLAAAWVRTEDIRPDAGPLAYDEISHLLIRQQFFHWGEGSVLDSPDCDGLTMINGGNHLEELIQTQEWEPGVFLPRRGDLPIGHGALIHGGTPMRDTARPRRSSGCHSNAAAAHRAMAPYRVGVGLGFSDQPSLPEAAQVSPLPQRIVNAARRRLASLLR